tara:strand:- start:410 stop:601 length:192 start_codon:yes stop_codon:yes gene_type:complete
MSHVKLDGFDWESVTVDASVEELSRVADALSEIGVETEFSAELGELLIFGQTLVIGIVSNDVG